MIETATPTLAPAREARHEGVIIGLAARKGVGKSTLADILRELLGAERLGFATALRHELAEMVEAYTGRPIGLAEIEAEKGTLYGTGLQFFGEWRRRKSGAEYWLRGWERRWRELGSPDVVIDDVRHLNEALFIRGRGGIVVVIEGPSRRPGDSRSADHPSERGVEEVKRLADITLHNSGSIQDLRGLAERLVLPMVGARAELKV